MYLPTLLPLFESLDQGKLSAVTSTLTLLETMVIPYRSNNIHLAEQYATLLEHGKGLALIPIDLPLLRLATLLRATTSVKTPDALQLAAALSAGCEYFLTNDRRFPQLPNLKILQLNDIRTK